MSGSTLQYLPQCLIQSLHNSYNFELLCCSCKYHYYIQGYIQGIQGIAIRNSYIMIITRPVDRDCLVRLCVQLNNLYKISIMMDTT